MFNYFDRELLKNDRWDLGLSLDLRLKCLDFGLGLRVGFATQHDATSRAARFDNCKTLVVQHFPTPEYQHESVHSFYTYGPR